MLVRLDAVALSSRKTEIAQEIASAEIPWRVHYSDYQSGTWWTCSLVGGTTDPADARVVDSPRPRRTELLRRLPAAAQLLEALPFRYMTARLARLDPGGALWEHRDYQDLAARNRQRLHLPLETNTRAYFVAHGCRWHLEEGALYAFCPTASHGICNRGQTPRLHLVMDVYDNAPFRRMFSSAMVASCERLPRTSCDDLVRAVRRHLSLADWESEGTQSPDDGPRSCERAALQLYFDFATPEGAVYEAIERVWRERGTIERAEFWAARRALVLGGGVRG